MVVDTPPTSMFFTLANQRVLQRFFNMCSVYAKANWTSLLLQEVLKAIKESTDILLPLVGGTVRMPAWLITNTADVATQYLHCDNFPVIDDTFVDYGAWQSTAGISVLHVLGDDRDIEILVKVY